MAKITLHNDKDLSATYVSNTFIDNYMTAANGEFVKIYLYLLRCMSAPDCSFSLSAAADKFEHTEKDVQRALKYWEKMNLLRLEYDTEKKLSGIYFLDSSSQEPEKQALPKEEPTSAAAPAATHTPAPEKPKKKSYTAAEMAAFQEQDNVRELLFVAEHYLKRPLTPTDINTVLFWYQELGFSVDLIEYLIEYCVCKNHTSLRYMDKVAMAWKDEGINTVERAKRNSSAFSQLHFSVMKALGIQGRNLVDSEITYIDKWSKDYGFTLDIISEACRRTISSTHQPSFEYTDGILSNWHKQNIHHLKDVVALDSQFQKTKATTAALQNKAASTNKFNNFTQRTYDYDKLEQQLLGKHSSQEVTCP